VKEKKPLEYDEKGLLLVMPSFIASITIV